MCGKNEAITIMHEVCEACDQAFEQKIHDAFLYGSYARGDNHEGSDIDILLTVDVPPEELRPYREAAAMVCSDLGLEHDVMISALIEPLSQFRRYSAALPYYRNVLREGIRYAAG